MDGSNARRQLAKNIAVPPRKSTIRIAGEQRTYRIAATVAPVTVSGGVVRLTAGRFQRATTRITPKKDKVFNRNAAPIPANAITKPASAGPTARAKLNSMPLSADAAGRSSFSTSSGKTARQVGVSNASPADSAKVRMRSSRRYLARDRHHRKRDRDDDHPYFRKQDHFAAIDDVAN